MTSNRCCHCTEGEHQVQISCLSLVPIFNHLSPEELWEISQALKAESYQRGEMIYRAGDPSQRLYIVHKGRVKIYRLATSGKEQLIRVLEPGDFTGELALFSESTHDAFAEALEPTELCTMDREVLQEFLLQFPTISLRILEEFSERLAKSERQTTSLATESVDRRIADYLLELSEDSGSLTVTLPVSRKDLASYLGTSPETISRRLAEFEDSGWISQREQRRIQILDPDALRWW
ncbi:MAG: Crp/Fnr family transcriptional regulator [Firmicutes bacterium]|nr:Crp/Fnr family transcriptional regulator [Bacillota bacterium]